jgi:acyl carrier protein
LKTEPGTVESELIRLLGRTLGDTASVQAGTDLVADLGLESIQVIEYLCEVEDHFDLALDEATLADVHTIADLAAVVRNHARS